MDMLEWLEGYLSAYQGGILIVSHDRYFLDRIVTGVVELDNHKATTYRGNYSRYIQQRDERLKGRYGGLGENNRSTLRKQRLYR